MYELFALVAVLGLSACGDKKEAPAATSAPKAVASDDPVAQMTVEHAKKDVAELTTKLAAHKANLFDCAATMSSVAEVQKYDAATATQIKKLCTHDIQLDLIQQAVDAAEPAHKAKPDAVSLSECSVDAGLSVEAMQEAGTLDDTAKALVARLDKACPLLAQVRADHAAKAAKATK